MRNEAARLVAEALRWTAIAGVAVSLLSSCARAVRPDAPDRRLVLETNASVFAAANGYLFAVAPDPKSKITHIEVRYPVGSAHDPAGKEGLAQLVAHLLLEVEVTRAEKPTSILAELVRVSLAWGSKTTSDSTTYSTRVVPAALDEVLRLESEKLLVGCDGISPAVFEREKEVVLDQLRQRSPAGEAELARSLYQALYPPQHPYARSRSVESVRAIERDDVCRFLADSFQRGAAIVVLSGDVTEEMARAAATRHFRQLPARGPASPPPTRVEPSEAPMTVLEAEVEEAILLVAWPLPPIATREYRFAQLAAGAVATRLGALASVHEWGEDVRVLPIGGAYAPYQVLQVSLRSLDRVSEAQDAIAQAVHHAVGDLHRDGEGKTSPRWQSRLDGPVRALLGRYQSLSGRAEMFAEFLQFEPEGGGVVGRLQEAADTTPREAQEIAEKWLDPARARTILVKPKPNRAGTIAASGVFGASGPTPHQVDIDPAAADLPIPLPRTTGLVFDTIRFRTHNRMQVLLWPNGDVPIVHGRLVIGSGIAHDPIDAAGAASLSGFDQVHDDSMVYEQRTLSPWVDSLIADLSLPLRDPEPMALDRFASELARALRSRPAEERLRYQVDLQAALYGPQHPYARPPLTSLGLARIDVEAVTDWDRAHIVPANATLVLAGKFDPELVRQHIEHQSGRARAGSDSPSIVVPPRGDAPAWIAGYGPEDSPVVEIDLGFLGGRGMDGHSAARLILLQVLDHELRAARDERMVGYGFHADYLPRDAGGYWHIHGFVEAARAAEAATALRETLARMLHRPDSYRASFLLARGTLLDRLLSQAGDSFAVAERLVVMARFGLADDYYDRLARDIAASALDQVHALLQRELAPAHQVFGAFGPRSAVDAAIAAARTR